MLLPLRIYRTIYTCRMEVIKMRSSSGMAKIAGITLCLAGALVIALYAGRSLSPLINNRHSMLGGNGDKQQAAEHVPKGLWILGTFLMLLACVAWSLWIIFQVSQSMYVMISKLISLFFVVDGKKVRRYIVNNLS